MKFLLVGLLAGIISATGSAASASRDDGWQIPLPSIHVSHAWALGEHRRELELDLDREASLSMDKTRMRVTVFHSHPALYASLLESLRSTAPTGYTLLARDRSVDIRLGQVSDLVVSTDAAGLIWLTGQASLRVQRAGKTPQVVQRKLAVAFKAVVVQGAVRLQPQSLDLGDVSPALAKKLLVGMGAIAMPIPACLQEQDLKLESVSLPVRANSFAVTLSLRRMSFTAIARCLAEMTDG